LPAKRGKVVKENPLQETTEDDLGPEVPESGDFIPLSTSKKSDSGTSGSHYIAEEDGKPRIVYIGGLPFGFFENQLQGFLRQFGIVEHVVVPRSKSTNRYKGYGFVGFENADVAKIVADTLHNYLLHGHRLKCSLVPQQKLSYQQFLTSYSRYTEIDIAYTISIKGRERNARMINKEKTPEQQQSRLKRLERKDKTKGKLLEKLGIEYKFPTYASAKENILEGKRKANGNGKQALKKQKTSTEKENIVTTFITNEYASNIKEKAHANKKINITIKVIEKESKKIKKL